MTDPLESFDAIYFLLPVPQPLPLPDGTAYSFSGPPAIDPFEMTADMRQGPPLAWYVSLAHHRRPGSLDQLEQLWELAAEVMPWALETGLGEEGVAHHAYGTRSVIEASVMLGGAPEGDGDVLGVALGRAIDCVNTLLRAVHLATRQPMQLVALGNLPPLIPGAVATVSEGRPPAVLRVFTHMNPRTATPGGVVELSESAFSRSWTATAQGHPLLRYVDLIREATWAADGEDNYWSAVVTTAAATEFLLTSVLQLLSWESGATPEEARGLFPQNAELGSRLTALANRLGGDWNGKGTGPAGQWMRRVAHLRNAALHQAKEVSAADARAALAAAIQLEQHVAGQLVKDRNLARYPRTALALLGADGLQRRGRETAAARNKQRELDQAFERFGRWREALIETPAAPTTTDRRELFGVFDKSGHLYWVLYAPELRQACQATLTGPLPTLQAQALRTLQQQLQSDPPPAPVSSWVVGGTSIAKPNGDWRPSRQLLPMQETLVGGDDVIRSLALLDPEIAL